MIFGYHTNGLPDVPPDRAVELLDEAGYGSIALPVGGRLFDPRQPGCWEKVEELAQTLRDRNLGSIVEMEPSQKMLETGEPGLNGESGVVGESDVNSESDINSEPDANGDSARDGDWSLIAADSDRRESYIKLCEHAIDTAAMLRSDCVVLCSGSLAVENSGEEDEGPDPDAAWDRLTDSLSRLLEYAEERAVPIGFEPTVGMLVDTTDAFSRLLGRVNSSMLRLSLDIASLYFSGETPLAFFLHVWSNRLVNIHLCDVRASVGNRRLMLGEGEIDFPPLFHLLDETGYSGGIHVRVDGPISGDGSEQMRQAMRFLRQAARFHL